MVIGVGGVYHHPAALRDLIAYCVVLQIVAYQFRKVLFRVDGNLLAILKQQLLAAADRLAE